MAPYNFLELAFPSSAAADEDGSRIAGAEELRQVREKVAGMRTRMTLARLSPAQRAQLGVPVTATQLEQAMACLRFLHLREDIAKAARVPAALLQETVEKDLALAQAQEAAEPLRAAALRGAVQLGAALTTCTDRIDWYVEEQAQSPDAPLEQRDRLRALFAAGGRLRRSVEAAAAHRQAAEARLLRRSERRLARGADAALRPLRRERLQRGELPTEEQLRRPGGRGGAR